ncbi:MAG: hypothetical protein Q7K54_04660 [Candidatus Parcubacteria bacterium]|nr:hypothetical protein [Candidatus Parcubacteria bacterium]
MKKPFVYAFSAFAYIISLVSFINFIVNSSIFPKKDNILMPMAMLCLLVLSAAIMGFFFLSEPLMLYIDGKKKEAVTFFGKTVGFFASFALILGVLILLFK